MSEWQKPSDIFFISWLKLTTLTVKRTSFVVGTHFVNGATTEFINPK